MTIYNNRFVEGHCANSDVRQNVDISYRIAVVKWTDDDGISRVISEELARLGHQVKWFKFNEAIPDGVDVVFSFAPYGRFLQIPRQLKNLPLKERPIFVHWNTENPPDLRLPWFIMSSIGACRSWLDRLNDSDNDWVQAAITIPPLSWVQKRMYKFRYVGDYHYAYGKGWIDILAESSEIYAQLHRQHGLPTIVVPWGTAQSWYADLNVERDIDVLWMGTRRTKRRSRLLDQMQAQLAAHGIQMYIADNIENPFVFDEERTQLLNRTKITLNLLPTWYDNAFPYRFHIAAGNRSLVVSEPLLSHCPIYEAGKHYVSTPVENMVESILYYLKHDDQRLQIVENAYKLVTTEMTFSNSIETIMGAVNRVKLAANNRLK